MNSWSEFQPSAPLSCASGGRNQPLTRVSSGERGAGSSRSRFGHLDASRTSLFGRFPGPEDPEDPNVAGHTGLGSVWLGQGWILSAGGSSVSLDSWI